MPLDGFDRLAQLADARVQRASLAVAGGDDPTVLAAVRTATDRSWIRPILIGPAPRIESLAGSLGIRLDGFTIHHAEGKAIAEAAVQEVRVGKARVLMKGQIATPALMEAVLDPATGLRSGRVVCQVVLMEIPRDGRRFLLADTGICVHPDLRKRIQILRGAVGVGHALGAARPKVALMAATETVKATMPETVEAAELSRRNQQGEFADCLIEGPLS
jgi:phosphotransacetylase